MKQYKSYLDVTVAFLSVEEIMSIGQDEKIAHKE